MNRSCQFLTCYCQRGNEKNTSADRSVYRETPSAPPALDHRLNSNIGRAKDDACHRPAEYYTQLEFTTLAQMWHHCSSNTLTYQWKLSIHRQAIMVLQHFINIWYYRNTYEIHLGLDNTVKTFFRMKNGKPTAWSKWIISSATRYPICAVHYIREQQIRNIVTTLRRWNKKLAESSKQVCFTISR